MPTAISNQITEEKSCQKYFVKISGEHVEKERCNGISNTKMNVLKLQ
jgi:hypothetical protein